MRFKLFKQHDAADCGPACLRMISEYYGAKIPLRQLREKCYIGKDGVSLTSLANAAEEIGFEAHLAELPLDDLKEVPFPCILHWNSDHFVVLIKINYDSNGAIKSFKIADPELGIRSVNPKIFKSKWLVTRNNTFGVGLFLEPSINFHNSVQNELQSKENPWTFILGYILKFRNYFFKIITALLLTTFTTLCFPFITQGVVDMGIGSRDISFIGLALIFQLLLFLSSAVTDFIQSQLLLHVSARINLSILTDFLSKLMKLPIRFFDSKNLGDILARLQDHRRIENFITSAVLRTAFNVFTFIGFIAVLASFNYQILIIFTIGSAASFLWTWIFMNRRRELDYQLFDSSARNNETVYELITGMQEIRLNGMEKKKQFQWKEIQLSLFRLNLATMRIDQWQSLGTIFFNQLKNILITFVSASLVVKGDITLGMMMSISYIIGSLNAPIDQFISFTKFYQAAKISLERMQEIYSETNEDNGAIVPVSSDTSNIEMLVTNKGLLEDVSDTPIIQFENVSFTYGNPKESLLIQDASFSIPKGKITAIVGGSGGGKSTLMKLMLKFYNPNKGQIYIQGRPSNYAVASKWRESCGIVMQDGFLFSDTIEQNIIGGCALDKEWLETVCYISCVKEILKNKPQGLQTKIGASGVSLSGGEKQRVLIARAIYKKPKILFFDEAISALDSETENKLINNLNRVYTDKTVIVIAHRLSTVKNADNIIVISEGKILENGSHQKLLDKRGHYFELVRNQLEMQS